MTEPTTTFTVKATEHTIITEHFLEPGYVVANNSEWGGNERGQLWELRKVHVEQPCMSDGFGRMVAEGDPDRTYSGYKLQRDGTHASGMQHQLWWLHNDEQAERAHLAALDPSSTVKQRDGYREKRGDELVAGDVLALPFGKIATITDVKVGRQYVNLRLAEYPKTRVGRYEPVMVQA